MESRNRLNEEKSPYLLQHQDNPVHWYAWGEAAFQAAQEQNKPIFLSVGYSTCHWCHVMAHQSYENQEVADYLNEHFISIKVDREERPDVDEIYMGAVHALGQRGGWPLSMFLTPNLKPFFGGTYWPKENFLYILRQINDLWLADTKKVMASGESLMQHLKAQKLADTAGDPLAKQHLARFFEQIQQNYDQAWGGFSPAPKFPHAPQISLLLRIYDRDNHAMALQMAVHTLEKMAHGGLFDHLGGGFARYSVDEQWRIPHFEKMLYDNALLAHTYLEAFQISGITLMDRVARETLDYVLREMQAPEGGYYSAQDADSEGEEGKYYVWTYEELKQLLSPEEFSAMESLYTITPQGNFENQTNHLNFKFSQAWEEKDEAVVQSAHKKLLAERTGRIPPHKDDKVLTSWNGLMIRSMAKGFQVTGEQNYLDSAKRAAKFIQDKLWQGGDLLARYRDGEAKFAARLEDYAYLIEGLIELYQCDFDAKVLEWAFELQSRQDDKFWNDSRGAYFFTDGDDPHLLLRSLEGMDGALPNANGVSALNLFRLSALNYREEWQSKAGRILQAFSKLIDSYPSAFAQMLLAYDYHLGPSPTWAILSGTDREGLAQCLKGVRSLFLPRLLLAVGEPGASIPSLLQGKEAREGKTTLYWCQEQRCEAPTQDLPAALKRLQKTTES